jgi:uncharacterized protein YndB with AHSA1/START domain
VTVDIVAAPSLVWHALTDPAEVQAWDGVRALDVPAGYPKAGHHARWRLRVLGLPVTLHDRIRAVEPEARLGATITVGFVRLAEEYLLTAQPGTTRLTSSNVVESCVPGLGWLAVRLTRASVAGSMARLARHCAGD